VVPDRNCNRTCNHTPRREHCRRGMRLLQFMEYTGGVATSVMWQRPPCATHHGAMPGTLRVSHADGAAVEMA
jgi:hypothetical protein